MTLRPLLKRSMVIGLVLAWAAGCASAPRQRAVKGGDVGQGAQSLSAARKFLQGRWALESFEVFPAGQPAILLKGSGTLNYDDFGNMRIEIRADEKSADLLRAAGVEMQDGVISSDGWAAVDMQKRTLTYVLKDAAGRTAVAGPLSAVRPRHWEVKGDLLILSTKDDNGKTLSTGRWRKTS